MFTQTIEDIIIEINIERLKSKEAQKINQTTDMIAEKTCLTHQQSEDQSTQSLSPQRQRSCSRSHRSCMMKKVYQKSKNADKTEGRKSYRKKWNRAEEELLCKLIGIHGSDFTFLEKQFPNKTRKQLKKKYQEIHKNQRYVSKIDSIESALMREKRKMFFDHEIMGIQPPLPQPPQPQPSLEGQSLKQPSMSDLCQISWRI